MTLLSKPTPLETVSGNLLTEAALTVVAAIAGGPLAPLLPALAKSLAASRQQVRVEAALAQVQETLEAHVQKVKNLTDEQYKLVNEAVLAMLQTTHSQKLAYLRNVVRNALEIQEVTPHEAVLLSRIIRDISAAEVEFLLRAFLTGGVHLIDATQDQPVNGNILLVTPASSDALSATGLLSLGLLAPPESGWDGGTMRFTRIVAKLIAVLRQPNA